MRVRSLALLVLMASAGCLPGDERPVPGSVQVDVDSNDTAATGFTTDDGWDISFDRFITALGDIRIHDDEEGVGDDSCADYAETRYDRLFDFTADDKSNVGLVYGLGTCSLAFRLRAPSTDSLLGDGVNAQDRELMRIEASDTHVTDERTSLLVRGRAHKDGVTKEFFWMFRRSYEIQRCRDEAGDVTSVVRLVGEDALTANIEVRPEELFRLLPSDDAPIEFGRIAAADADDDGLVTIEELDAVTIPFEPVFELLRDLLPEDLIALFESGSFAQPSLGTLIYEVLSPRVARFAGSRECEFEIRNGFPF